MLYSPPATSLCLLGFLRAANMNTTTDQTIALNRRGSKARISTIFVANPSISLTTAAGGLYTAATKGGTALVLATQAYSGLVAADDHIILTQVAAAQAKLYTLDQIFFSLTTAQGAAATADIYVYGHLFPV